MHNIKKIYARIMAEGGDLDDLTSENFRLHNLA